MNKKSLVKLLFLLIVVMFLFPWVLVSCSGQKMGSATGIQIVSGHYEDFTGSRPAAVGKPNAWIIAVLALSVLGFIIDDEDEEAVMEGLSCLSLFQSAILIGFLYEAPIAFMKSLGQDAIANMINFDFQPAFYVTLSLSVICTFLCFIQWDEPDKEKVLPVTASPQSISPPVDTSDLQFCPSCGYGNPKGSRFCLKCGTALTAPDDPAKES